MRRPTTKRTESARTAGGVHASSLLTGEELSPPSAGLRRGVGLREQRRVALLQRTPGSSGSLVAPGRSPQWDLCPYVDVAPAALPNGGVVHGWARQYSVDRDHAVPSTVRNESCAISVLVFYLSVILPGSRVRPSANSHSWPGPAGVLCARLTSLRVPVRCPWFVKDSYLVDPASSHMLVSKIKPCMSKYEHLYCETANGSLNQL